MIGAKQIDELARCLLGIVQEEFEQSGSDEKEKADEWEVLGKVRADFVTGADENYEHKF